MERERKTDRQTEREREREREARVRTLHLVESGEKRLLEGAQTHAELALQLEEVVALLVDVRGLGLQDLTETLHEDQVTHSEEEPYSVLCKKGAWG